MSILNFSNVKYIKSIDTGELIRCGGFKIGQKGEIGNLYTSFYVHGTPAGTERFRTKLYLDPSHKVHYCTSEWSNLSDATTGNWFGLIRSDYNGENINPNITYYVEVEFDSYTRVGETFWIGVARDFPDPIYTMSPAPTKFFQYPMATQIFIWINR